MDLLCPECFGKLAVEGQQARCTVHTGSYRMLYCRPVLQSRVVASPPVAASTSVPGSAEASLVFGDTAAPPVLAGPRYPGMHCVQHPHADATARCDSCGAYMCATCDFALPGAVHVCPSCAVASQNKMGSKRKKLMIWAYVLAGWSTFAFALFFVMAARHQIHSKDDEAAVGALFSLGILVPTFVGFGLSLGSIDRRFKNPPAAWVAVVWNSILLASLLLLMVIGAMR